MLSVKGDLATVQITRTFEEISRGDLARPWTEQNLRIAPKPNTRELRGMIVSAVRHGVTTFGEANEVFLDKGANDGVEVGNTFAVPGTSLGTYWPFSFRSHWTWTVLISLTCPRSSPTNRLAVVR